VGSGRATVPIAAATLAHPRRREDGGSICDMFRIDLDISAVKQDDSTSAIRCGQKQCATIGQ
jgi:hypothetical protein